jgi:hypothetical protein
MKFSFWFAIIVGLFIFGLSAWRSSSAYWGAAVGLFFVLLGLHGFTAIRIKTLEAAVKRLQERDGQRDG